METGRPSLKGKTGSGYHKKERGESRIKQRDRHDIRRMEVGKRMWCDAGTCCEMVTRMGKFNVA